MFLIKSVIYNTNHRLKAPLYPPLHPIFESWRLQAMFPKRTTSNDCNNFRHESRKHAIFPIFSLFNEFFIMYMSMYEC